MKSIDFNARQAFAEDGEVAARLSEYVPRKEQIRMSEAIWGALSDDHALVVEAGTGVGKTLSYLLPVLAYGKRTLISTGTRHLQDQLYDDDLPLALKATGQNARVCVLKGRANYLCLYRYDEYVRTTRSKQLPNLQQWRDETRFGDLAEMGLGENDRVIPLITSSEENCLGKKCKQYRDCYVTLARDRARTADVVVTNHHLLATDMAMGGELLPKLEVLVLDEAHRLNAALESVWGTRLTTGGFQMLCRDADKLSRRPWAKSQAMGASARALQQVVAEMQKKWQALYQDPVPNERLLPPENFAGHARPLREQLEQFVEILGDQVTDKEDAELEKLILRSRNMVEELSAWPRKLSVYCDYLCFTRTGFELHSVPIDVSKQFVAARENYPSRWVYTSATMSVAGNFDYFMQQLGLDPGQTKALQLHSPFDFTQQALLYLPPDLPEPNEKNYTETMLEAILPLLQQLHGRTFMLFTSFRAMEQATKWLEPRLDCMLLMQGTNSRQELLKKFAATDNAVLLGSASFWEGVDVPGPALSCVIIDKIPFESHHDLLFKARAALVEEQGGKPFLQLQLPRAALMLKQGCGRLIRRITDRGLLVIADPRLETKRYGKTLLDSLPNAPASRDLAQALQFLEGLES